MRRDIEAEISKISAGSKVLKGKLNKNLFACLLNSTIVLAFIYASVTRATTKGEDHGFPTTYRDIEITLLEISLRECIRNGIIQEG